MLRHHTGSWLLSKSNRKGSSKAIAFLCITQAVKFLSSHCLLNWMFTGTIPHTAFTIWEVLIEYFSTLLASFSVFSGKRWWDFFSYTTLFDWLSDLVTGKTNFKFDCSSLWKGLVESLNALVKLAFLFFSDKQSFFFSGGDFTNHSWTSILFKSIHSLPSNYPIHS